MINFSIRELPAAPSPEDIEAVTNVARDAFETDLFHKVSTDGHPDGNVSLQHAIVVAGSIAGVIQVAEIEEEGKKTMVGASVSFPPGRNVFDSKDQLEAGLMPFFNILSDESKKWWTEYFRPEYEAYSKTVSPKEEQAKVWHLQLLAVTPLCQKKGIGKALYRKVLEKAQATNSILCLETQTEDNVLMYESNAFGMHVVGRREFVGTIGSFPLIWMST